MTERIFHSQGGLSYTLKLIYHGPVATTELYKTNDPFGFRCHSIIAYLDVKNICLFACNLDFNRNSMQMGRVKNWSITVTNITSFFPTKRRILFQITFQLTFY